MRLFLDSSNIDEVRRWKHIIEGVTTNPAIVAKDGTRDFPALVKEAGSLPISIQVMADDLEQEAVKMYARWPNIVIKTSLVKPDGSDNMAEIEGLLARGIPVNCTALLSPAQVILAAQLKCTYASLFIGRIDDDGGNYVETIQTCLSILEGTITQLIIGSIRTVSMVINAVVVGAHIVTVPPPILEKIMMNQKTIKTLQEFQSAAQAFQSATGVSKRVTTLSSKI